MPTLQSLSLSREGADGNAVEEAPSSELPLMCQLANACRRHFIGGGNPSPGGVNAVADIMNRIRAQDLGLVSNGQKLRHIEFVDVLETPEFTVGIFLIPEGRFLPLHDHPGMTVLSKVVFGELLVTSFDKSDYTKPTSQRDFEEPFSAVVRSAGEVVGSEDACKVLHPTCDGNLHEFVARTDCGLLDILAPPYDFEGGRPCNYFQVVEGTPDAVAAGGRNGGQLAVGSVVKMIATEVPNDFYTLRRPYTGPELTERSNGSGGDETGG
eukprot:CAMPEP_0181296488 /NCGR_PEP_ID=MMETSP1101-20121128/4733_1 /TAXON_ID=46948 /ORGANISM="Rhodomonas abbreviata, Strain Caron Lab Isolate" /LENGTH=266 /DNA_ID=CAMNT_0023401361 /DNA_START=443 /DNA_END=1243 /DNA_ORIENTATION=+